MQISDKSYSHTAQNLSSALFLQVDTARNEYFDTKTAKTHFSFPKLSESGLILCHVPAQV